MKRKYLHPKCLPPRFPIVSGAVGWLLLDRFAAPGWAYGVWWSLIAVVVAAHLMKLARETPVDFNE